jgi:hypothetical protein
VGSDQPLDQLSWLPGHRGARYTPEFTQVELQEIASWVLRGGGHCSWPWLADCH